MNKISNFSLKFIDIMIAMVLGLGFQWWVNLQYSWQYAAFIFCYIDIIDYWIDYSPALKKFPPKREIDIILDVAIMFALFLYIYTTQTTIFYFLIAFSLFKTLDFFWLLSSKSEYKPVGLDKVFVNTWLKANFIEVLISLGLLFTVEYLSALTILIIFIIMRAVIRVYSSAKYKKIHFV